jgi:AraC-like DNA-binding protein
MESVAGKRYREYIKDPHNEATDREWRPRIREWLAENKNDPNIFSRIWRSQHPLGNYFISHSDGLSWWLTDEEIAGIFGLSLDECKTMLAMLVS